jgi:ParB family chromosome partitioning protein
MVVDVDDESAFISLTGNIARRKLSPLELMTGIKQLQEQG